MIVQTNLYPVCRGKASKSGKVPMTFVSSWYGQKDSDGFFVETSVVSPWLPSEIAAKIDKGSVLTGVIDVNGDYVSLKEITCCGEVYVLGRDSAVKDVTADENISF